MDLSTGEMAHLFYSTLGNTGYYDTGGSPTGCSGGGPPYCLTNTGPFSNLQPYGNWSGATYAPDPGNAWYFVFYNGAQYYLSKSNPVYAWAVSPGDALVPVPAAVWLFGSALGVMGLLRRKAQTGTGA